MASPKAFRAGNLRYPIGGCLFPDKSLWVNRTCCNHTPRVDNGCQPSLVKAHIAEHGLQSFDRYADGEQIDHLVFSQDWYNHRGKQTLLLAHDDVRYDGPFLLRHPLIEFSDRRIRARQWRSPGHGSIEQLSRLSRSPHDDREAKRVGNGCCGRVECLQISSSQLLRGSQCFHNQAWSGQFAVDRSRQFVRQCLRPLDGPLFFGLHIRPGGQGTEQQDREHESRREDQKEGGSGPFPPQDRNEARNG
ncbi:hypothetical protein EFR01_35760 [Sinorhizobium fredii]|nr:hypothetical protein EFR01_35760 [Sinorhizobium fredii]GLS11336.1 hypothetical protein GCM10007864_49670 [Sinorhizobium fredii]